MHFLLFCVNFCCFLITDSIIYHDVGIVNLFLNYLLISDNQVGSPMPPRPPSNQIDSQNRIQSPMANQGKFSTIYPHVI